MAFSAIVLSGNTVSSNYTLENAAYGFTCVVPSGSPGVLLAFAPTEPTAAASGQGVFFPYVREDGSGTRWVVASGLSCGVVARPPTPWFRLETSAAPSATKSCTIIPRLI